jgi:8-oxo-dGTP diphosphatase
MKIKEQTPAVLAIIRADNKFLLTKRHRKSRFEPGKWGFVGEAINFGEEIIDALKRGIKEETNLDLKSCELFNIYSFVFDSPDKTRHAFIIAYICECEGEVELNQESEDYGWYDFTQIKESDLIKGNEIIVNDLEKFLNNS